MQRAPKSLARAPSLALPAIAQEKTSAGCHLFMRHCAKYHGEETLNSRAARKWPVPDRTKIAKRREPIWPTLEIMSIIDGYAKTSAHCPEMPIIQMVTVGARTEFDTGNGIPFEVLAHLIAIAQYSKSAEPSKSEKGCAMSVSRKI